jgi:hypothetical protein
MADLFEALLCFWGFVFVRVVFEGKDAISPVTGMARPGNIHDR